MRFPRIFTASALLLAALLLAACQPLSQSVVSQPQSEAKTQSSNAEVLYVATGHTILAYAIDANGEFTFLDSMPFLAGFPTKLRTAKAGRLLLIGGGKSPDYRLYAARLTADGKFDGDPAEIMENIGYGTEFEVTSDGELLVTNSREPYDGCSYNYYTCKYYYAVIATHRIADVDGGLQLAPLGRSRTVHCSGYRCSSGVSMRGNWRLQGERSWLLYYDQVGSLGSYYDLESYPVDPDTGEIGKVTYFPIGMPVGEDHFVLNTWGYWPLWLGGYSISSDMKGKAVWNCGPRYWDWSFQLTHEGCNSYKSLVDGKVPVLLSFNEKGLWSFPFTAAKGPDITNAHKVEFKSWPREWFLLPGAQLLVGFGDDRYRTLFAFHVMPTGELQAATGPPGGMPQGIQAITLRPRP